ncbi:hypothetical protein [Dyella sp. Tek66A03]|uniref:hypothetical protein n=1 Tax=Dyella sp. Tek66A03 TaxID=3458298 RepID=UPI00403EBD08
MSTHRDDDLTAFIGLDWADAKHDFCLQPVGGEAREFGTIAHRPDAIDAWARALHQRFDGRITIALELAKGPVVYALQKYDFIVSFPIEPGLLAKHRPTADRQATRYMQVVPTTSLGRLVSLRLCRAIRWLGQTVSRGVGSPAPSPRPD